MQILTDVQRDYIKASLAKRRTQKAITDILVSTGWSLGDAESAVRQVALESAKPKSIDRRRWLALASSLLVVAAISGIYAWQAHHAKKAVLTASSDSGDRTGTVTGVVNADLLLVSLNGKVVQVQIIGVNAPKVSSVQCYAKEARNAVEALVKGRSVVLHPQPALGDTDAAGHLLRDVSISSSSANLAQTLLDNGYGNESTNTENADRLKLHGYLLHAKAIKLGMWNPIACPAYASPTAG